MSKAEKLARFNARLAASGESPPRTELDMIARDLRLAAANEPDSPLVNEFAEKHGDYVGEGNKGKRNRGGTPIARWKSDGLLSETQCLAIDYCIRLWERAGRFSNLTQDLMKITGLPPSSGWSQQEALDELKTIKGWFPQPYFSIFENVCRFDEPAGVAGSRLSTNTRSAQESAKTCVCFVADYIAKKRGLEYKK
jgi:hypothetical protein